MAEYPPEPWQLRGQLHASAFLVPRRELPDDLLTALPPGYQLVRWWGKAVVATAWVVYEPGGVLSYRELMATVLMRRGRRVVPSVVRIWVDDETSREGGRALWGIPKQLAEFQVIDFADGETVIDGTEFAAHDENGAIATGTVRVRRSLPRTWPVRFAVVQVRDGKTLVSPVRARATLSTASARFDAAVDGPLGFLAGRRPLRSFAMRDFRMTFGQSGR